MDNADKSPTAILLTGPNMVRLSVSVCTCTCHDRLRWKCFWVFVKGTALYYNFFEKNTAAGVPIGGSKSSVCCAQHGEKDPTMEQFHRVRRTALTMCTMWRLLYSRPQREPAPSYNHRGFVCTGVCVYVAGREVDAAAPDVHCRHHGTARRVCARRCVCTDTRRPHFHPHRRQRQHHRRTVDVHGRTQGDLGILSHSCSSYAILLASSMRCYPQKPSPQVGVIVLQG